jgi:hypothetical protein
MTLLFLLKVASSFDSAGEKLCGVGITFVEDSNGALYVKSLVNGGSAALSGQIQVDRRFGCSSGYSFLFTDFCHRLGMSYLKSIEIMYTA